jgi:hypothetical protein
LSFETLVTENWRKWLGISAGKIKIQQLHKFTNMPLKSHRR